MCDEPSTSHGLKQIICKKPWQDIFIVFNQICVLNVLLNNVGSETLQSEKIKFWQHRLFKSIQKQTKQKQKDTNNAMGKQTSIACTNIVHPWLCKIPKCFTSLQKQNLTNAASTQNTNVYKRSFIVSLSSLVAPDWGHVTVLRKPRHRRRGWGWGWGWVMTCSLTFGNKNFS